MLFKFDAQQLHVSRRMADRIRADGPGSLPDSASSALHTGMYASRAAVDPACIDNPDPGIPQHAHADACSLLEGVGPCVCPRPMQRSQQD